MTCNDFTPAGIRRNYAENEEEKSRFEQVGRAHNFVGYEPPEFLRRMDAIGVDKLLVCAIKTWSYKEQRLLENSLTELRFRFVQASEESAKAAGQKS